MATGPVDGVPLVETLGRFDPANSGSPLVGGLIHVAVSDIYGVGLALLDLVLDRWVNWRRYGCRSGAASSG
ncbi:hypothetical protein [Promineifilum sp.]|uniref:hypothetical protein n=1 Tax=Promineifilum sp. TaxID=2664178 RepID=UPI0035B45329